MSSSSPYDDRTPQTFAEVNPTGDLTSHRNPIAYALGEINANIKHLTIDLKENSGSLGKLKESTEVSLKEVKASLKIIEDKVLVAETQVKSAFFTSKYFLMAVAAVFGWIVGNWSWVARSLGLHQ